MDMADLAWISASKRPWDPPLSPFGQSQAKQRGILFANSLPVDVVVSSPFTRCIETASSFMQAYGLPADRLIVDACVAEWMSLRNLNLAHVPAQDRAKLKGNVEDWFWGVEPHAGLKAVLAAAWGSKTASKVSSCVPQ
jgi:broad specificity phosphatase PhoE